MEVSCRGGGDTDEIDRRFHVMVSNFYGRRTRTKSWRKGQIKAIQNMVYNELSRMQLAIQKDLECLPGKFVYSKDIDAELLLSKCCYGDLDDEAPHSQMVLLIVTQNLMPFNAILLSLIPLIRNGCCV